MCQGTAVIQLDLDQIRLSIASERSKLRGKVWGKDGLAHLQARQIHRPVFRSVTRYNLLFLDFNKQDAWRWSFVKKVNE